ncbi:MAG: extracellular solute-binding protein [Actinomycetota bacterium]|nr:extracellular solute-binding protein [Actinomycetota bacterium]
MRRSIASLWALGLAGSIGLVGVATAAPSASARAHAVTITLYNGQHVQTTDALVRAFTRRTGITVAVRSEDEGALVNEIEAEGSRSPADVVFTENSPALESLQGHGLLARLPKAIRSATPARFGSPRGDWVGVTARVSVIVYNPALIRATQLPRSVLALGTARYRRELALAPGETDFQPIITAVAARDGTARTRSWLEGMKANAAGHLYPDNETVTNDVNRGLVALGVINQYYWYRLRAQIGARNMHARIAEFAPRDPGYVLDVSGAGVLAASPHRRAAERFVAFLVSRAGQSIIDRSDSFEYPLAKGVPAPTGEAPLASLRPDPISIAELGDGHRAVQLLEQAGLL